MWKAERALDNRPVVASPPPTWSVTACLTYRGGLEIRAAAENILPGWGHGGESLSFLLRLRRRFRLAVTSKCGRTPTPAEQGKKTRGLKILRFLRSRLARAPRVPSVLHRPPPPRAAVARPSPRTPAIPSLLKNLAPMRPATTMAICFVAALAVAAALRLMVWLIMPNTSCASWKCFLVKKLFQSLGPPLFEWLSKISSKFLDPPLCEWLGLPKLSLKWLFNK